MQHEDETHITILTTFVQLSETLSSNSSKHLVALPLYIFIKYLPGPQQVVMDFFHFAEGFVEQTNYQ